MCLHGYTTQNTPAQVVEGARSVLVLFCKLFEEAQLHSRGVTNAQTASSAPVLTRARVWVRWVRCVRASEYIFATAVELIGNVFVAILVGNVLGVLESMNVESEKHRERMDGIEALMTQHRLPKHIRRQLRKWVVRSPCADGDARFVSVSPAVWISIYV